MRLRESARGVNVRFPVMKDYTLATADLVKALGHKVVLTAEDARYAASFDGSRLSFMPAAVIKARNRDDLGAVLVAANAAGVPVTVRGRGTTLTGGA